jgi:hypothetical protein
MVPSPAPLKTHPCFTLAVPQIAAMAHTTLGPLELVTQAVSSVSEVGNRAARKSGSYLAGGDWLKAMAPLLNDSRIGVREVGIAILSRNAWEKSLGAAIGALIWGVE